MKYRKTSFSLGILLALAAPVHAQERWIKFAAISVCPTIKIEANCPILATGTKLTILGPAVTDLVGRKFYRISSEKGSGYVDAHSLEQIITNEDPKITAERERKEQAAAAAKRKAECERRGQPKIGMVPADLIASCWGRPARIIKKTTANGIEENYVYGSGHIVKFLDGKVAEIIETR